MLRDKVLMPEENKCWGQSGYDGKIKLQFFIYGSWEVVEIDDRLPVRINHRGKPKLIYIGFNWTNVCYFRLRFFKSAQSPSYGFKLSDLQEFMVIPHKLLS